MPDLKAIQEAIANEDTPNVIEITDKLGKLYLGRDGKTPATMSVIGEESPRYRDRLAALEQERVKAGIEDVSTDEWAIDRCAAAVVDWAGWFEGKTDLECSTKNVRDVLRIGHIRRQVDAARRQHALFFARASGS